MDYPSDGDTLYEDAACGLLATTTDGTILRANRTFCAALGRTQGDVIGVRLQSLLTVGGRIFHQTHWAPLLKMQGSLAEVKLEMLHADGRRIPMVMNAIVRRRGDADRHELAVFSARDRNKYEQELLLARERAESHLRREIDGQKALAEAQARLELAMGAAQLYQWSVRQPHVDRFYAPEVAILLGEGVRRPVLAAEFIACIHPADRRSEAEAVSRLLDSTTHRMNVRFRLNGLDGVQRWVEAWGVLRSDDAGEQVDLIGMLQDVTESQRQREIAEDRALLAEQTLGIVGHDLRNPLSAIQMSADVLATRTLGEAMQQSVLARIRASTRRANRLIADLLDFTRARNGRTLALARSSVDGHAIARDIVAELSAAHPSRVLKHMPSGDARLSADSDRLAQALGNLISNALAYGLPKSPVTVSTIGSEGLVRFEVHNLGAPIHAEHRDRLFEPMTRGQDAGDLRSVGLGLYIVREIALAHGGSVDCVSDLDQGTTFFLEVPRLAEASLANSVC
jgi:sigma-B regulation protein RsbU (phosphoserine phosphatase)